jgi:hypothetical protein
MAIKVTLNMLPMYEPRRAAGALPNRLESQVIHVVRLEPHLWYQDMKTYLWRI